MTEEEINSIIAQCNKNETDRTLGIMNLIAKKRGAIFSKDNVDYEKISKILLDDFRSGKLGKITLEKANG